MGAADNTVSWEIVKEAALVLEPIRQAFQNYTNAWLLTWYRDQAVQIATSYRENSERIGVEGIRAFKEDVEQVVAQTQQIVDLYLCDDVWWHFDTQMDFNAVAYSVRLCMGRLAIPLHRHGYVHPAGWREKIRYAGRFLSKNAVGHKFADYEDFSGMVNVPTKRFFFNHHEDEKGYYLNVDDWSPDMRSNISNYFGIVERTTKAAWEQEEREWNSKQEQAAARIADAVSFTRPK